MVGSLLSTGYCVSWWISARPCVIPELPALCYFSIHIYMLWWGWKHIPKKFFLMDLRALYKNKFIPFFYLLTRCPPLEETRRWGSSSHVAQKSPRVAQTVVVGAIQRAYARGEALASARSVYSWAWDAPRASRPETRAKGGQPPLATLSDGASRSA